MILDRRLALLGAIAMTASAAPAPSGAHAFRFAGLLGGEIALQSYRGKALLVVNTATECGLTGQLGGLQSLYEARRDEGLVVIGVPSNDFGGQEPREGKAIAEFCALNYGVAFPMTERTRVIGPRAHFFYVWARAAFGEAGVPRWNFHKLVIDKNGQPVQAFASRVPPSDPAIAAAIARALA